MVRIGKAQTGVSLNRKSPSVPSPSIMANGWTVSNDLRDAYSCFDTSETQKIPSVRLQTSGLSVHGLTVRNVPKPTEFLQINECNSNKVTTTCRISLPIPRQLANKRSDSQSTYLAHKIHSLNGTNLDFVPNLKKSDLIPTRIHR